MNVGRVFALNLRLAADFKVAEELTKQVFLTTWERIAQMRDDITFASWLKGLTVSAALDKVRGKSGKLKSDTTHKNSDRIPRKYESVSLFDRDIIGLSDRERIIFVLHDLENYSEEEIADFLHLEKENIKESLGLSHQLLETSVNYVLADKNLQEKIDTLNPEINPQADLWSGIFHEINKIKIKSQEEIIERRTFEESAEEDKPEVVVNKKSKHWFGEIDNKKSNEGKKSRLSDYFKRFKK